MATTEAEVLAGFFPFPRLMLSHGDGAWVWSEEGRRYLDFTSGLGVLALGHGRKDLGEILGKQFGTLAHTSNLFGNRPALQLAERLVKHSFASRVWFCNSGTEANEAALKFARIWGHKDGKKKHAFIAFEQGFHGRTFGALSVTHTPAYREPFQPALPGVRFAKFNDLASVRAVLDDDVCAVLVEPVQGEGGVIPADAAFLRGLRELCDRHKALLIFDEVQCGMGRTGSLWAYEQYAVVPDLMCIAKPLAGGLPIGAVLISQDVASLLKPGQHGSTFAGGPAVAAVAAAVFDIINNTAFLQNVQDRAKALSKALSEVRGATRIFSEQRGVGLMQALIVADPKKYNPSDVVTRARAHGLLVTRAGDAAVRLLPPLVCTPDQIAQATDLLTQAAEDVAAGKVSL